MTAIFSDDTLDEQTRFAGLLDVNHRFGVQHHPEQIAALKERHGLA
ncbi:hypothetical protein [Pseudonocardia pini]|nr:hypothetical protein [Pseudonocardia pini]